VLALAPAGPKTYRCWHGPSVLTEVKSSHSCGVEIDGKHKHLHVNHLRGYSDRLLSAYDIIDCAAIHEKDNDFGIDETGNDSPVMLIPPSQIIEPEKRICNLNRDLNCCRFWTSIQKCFPRNPSISLLLSSEHDINANAEFKPKVHRSRKNRYKGGSQLIDPRNVATRVYLSIYD
jgi:hypothetical protein